MKIKTLLFILAALTVTGVATQADNTSLYMTVHHDYAGSAEILNQDFARGVKRTKMALRAEQSISGHSVASSELFNNLCVAYVKQNELKKARTVCKRAVSHAMQTSSGIGQNPKAIKRVKAAALSNRGVLNMLDGKLDRALADFNKASTLSPALGFVQLNMAAATTARSESGLAVVID
ncbi:MAG: tetratricopeptide repeat protein [Pseudomonadota bacterium]